MAYDKVVDAEQLDADLTIVADAIRTKGGTTEQLSFPQGMKQAVEAIQSGGGSGEDTLALLLTNDLITYRNDTIKKLKAYLFQDNTNVVSLFFPNVRETHSSMFRNCQSLKEIDLSNTVDIASSCFYQCYALEKADFPKVTSIYTDAFVSAGIKHLVLRSTTVCNLKHVSAFNNTPIKNGTGYVYVPRDLIESYQTATNWSTYANQFRALEDYTVDGTITGELDESKI